MKKVILIIIAIIVILMPRAGKAISYRGFFEVAGTCDLNQKFPSFPQFLGQFSTTHGVQVSEMFFVGLGAGAIIATGGDNARIYYVDKHYNTDTPGLKEDIFASGGDDELIPIFLDVRWDGFGLFKNGSKIVPFIDLKAGYSFFTRKSPSVNEYYVFHTVGETKILCYHNGYYMQPSIGMRIRLSRLVGINLGLTYNFLPGKISSHFTVSEPIFNNGYYDYDIKVVKINNFKNKLVGSFGILIGIDF